jgi:acetoin utilization protein AcuB
VDDWTSFYQIDETHRVSDTMTRNPETVRAADSILKAVRIFREHRYGALPVLNKDDELVGILSAQDLLGALEELLNKGGS